ncbi:hypothetical protein QCE63_33660, partial [Caballeronia sp. LZ065]|nr:hypothetical protein [Caballeronia sp. LZ065]
GKKMQRQSFTHDKPTCVRAQFDKYNGLFSVALAGSEPSGSLFCLTRRQLQSNAFSRHIMMATHRTGRRPSCAR